jgi:ATP:ADP antiporter, AAA family
MTEAAQPVPATMKSPLDRFLSIFAEVRAGEATTAMLLTTNAFLILAAYYVIRPLRDALLLPVRIDLPGGGVLTGPEIKSYTGGILAGLFIFIVPLYGLVASRVSRVRLINGVTVFFTVTLSIFVLLGNAGVPPTSLGLPFFLWIGIFNLMVVAQFWSFATDVYTNEQGKRLFAILGFGASAGALAGSAVTAVLLGPLGEFNLMLVSGGILLACLVLTNIVHVREKARAIDSERKVEAERPLATDGGFQLVMAQRYLLLIGLLTLAAQLVNTNGNYILGETLTQMARAQVASGSAAGISERQIIGSYMAGTDFWQNLLGVLIQLFLVSRIFKYLGVGKALFILPTIALGSYGLFAAAPILALIRLAKVTENATDYSLQNTVRRALFLPTSREAKYKALQAVETFFWRAGDMLSGLATFLIVQIAGWGVRPYAIINLMIVVGWLIIAAALSRENRRLTTAEPAAAAA